MISLGYSLCFENQVFWIQSIFGRVCTFPFIKNFNIANNLHIIIPCDNDTVENSTVRVKLQEEAGGSGSFYQATDDDISIDVQYVGSEGTSGIVFVPTLEGGSLTLDPAEFYFGCNKTPE